MRYTCIRMLRVAFIVCLGLSLSHSGIARPLAGEEIPESGAYKISLGLFKPDFSESERYEDFYGSPKLGASIFIEHFPWEYAVTLGYSVRFSYYQAAGHAGIESGETIQKDKTTSTDLTIIPVQVSLSMIATPFPQSKWFTLSGWIGFERAMFDESRRQGSGESTTGSDAGSSKTYANSGFKNATVVGGSLNILIKPKSGTETIDVLGMRRVFLSPYIEIVKSMEKEGLQLGGKRLGVAFSFELND